MRMPFFPRRKVASLIATLLAFVTVATANAADQTWTGTTSSSWATGTNWSGGAMPGTTSTVAATKNANHDVATIVTTSPFRNPIAIPGATLALGEIDFQGTSNQMIGASGATGVDLILQLNGDSANNVILHNSGSATLTLQPNNGQATPNTLVILLGNTTNNLINIDSSGGINIGVAITGATRNLTLNGSSTGILTFSGSAANTYTGTTTINEGELDLSKTAGVNAIAGSITIGDGAGAAGSATLKLLNDDQINNTSSVTVNSDGTLDIGAFSDSVANPVLEGGTITGTTGVLTASVGNFHLRSGSVDAILGGSGGVIKTTTGTVALSKTNTYTGTTTISGGKLFVNTATGSLAAASAVTVSNSGTVLGGNGGTINGSVSVGTGAILEGGTGSTGQTLNLTGAVSMSGGSIIELALGSSFTHSTLAVSGGGSMSFATGTGASSQMFTFIDLGATTGTYQDIITGVTDPGLTISNWTITNAGYTGSFFWDGANIDLTLTAVPEPSTWVAAALAAAVIGYSLSVNRNRKKRLAVRA